MQLFGIFYVSTALVGLSLLIVRFRDHTETQHTRSRSFRRAICPSQGPLPDNTQRWKDADIHAPGGIRTRNPSKRAAADPRLRLRGHWDRQL